MKKIILEENKDQVYLSDLNDDSIVGVVFEENTKGFLFKSEKGFTAICNDEIDISENWYASTIEEYVSDDVVKQAYQFKTMKGLFKWLAED